MVYALDTNIISYLLRPNRNQELVQRFLNETQENDYVIPPFCYYETLWYLLRKKAATQMRTFTELYNNSLAKISMGEAEFIKASEIKAGLEEHGTPIGKDADIFIAAYCIINDYTLVTNNPDDFEKINELKKELKFVNWIE